MDQSNNNRSSKLTEADYSNLAQQGIQLMLNNKFDQAETLFLRHTNDSLHVAVGYSYLTFMNAVMSFEEEKVQHSLETLRSLERRCEGGENGWFSSVKNIVFGSNKNIYELPDDIEHSIEQEIILADCHVLLAILTFLQQELGAYVKGGWVLRKAWKVYENTYIKVKQEYVALFGSQSLQEVPPTNDLQSPVNLSPTPWDNPPSSSAESVPSSSRQSSVTSSDETDASNSSVSEPTRNFRLPMSKSVPNLKGILSNKQNNKKPLLPKDLIIRLMSAVSFGYGLFQLCMSLLPPSLLKVVHVLGLPGDKMAGLAALMFARKSKDMRAPLAKLALLWYHTVVQPFFALNSMKVRAGVSAAHLLLEEEGEQYAESALFLLFRGRVNRLKGDIPAALTSYRASLVYCNQREVQLLALHEIAWCHLLQLNWGSAHTAFSGLKRKSRWSKSFYAYLSAICSGALGNEEGCVNYMLEVPDLIRRSNHTLEAFILRRATKASKECITQQQCLLRIFEILYLWNALPTVSETHRLHIIQECEQMKDQGEYEGLRQLILGAASITLDIKESAAMHLMNCLEQRTEDPNEEIYIPVFASFELGILLASRSETRAEGKKLLEKARDTTSDYDFKNRLSVRIHAALKALS